MPSIATWKLARPPNYNTNIDKIYPYSEVPFIGQYNLVKIPISLNNVIELVDYWGEGRIITEAGASGFSNCYNVNHEYQLVSNGSDSDRKIPNRVPVISYTNCDTSSYIKDNSVKIVTLMGAPINKSCANDVARIVNSDFGKVVVFGFDKNSQFIENLEDALKNKNIVYCYECKLSSLFETLTLFDSHIAYLNLKDIGNELHDAVLNSAFEKAVQICVELNKTDNGATIYDTVNILLKEGITNVMPFAYKVWKSGATEIVINYFPIPFKQIFNEDYVKILSKKYGMGLKLDANKDEYGDRLAWGDLNDKTSYRVSWKLSPEWVNDKLFFKIKNTEYETFLKLDVNVDEYGDRKAWGSNISNESRYFWILEPLKVNNELVFYIMNREYNQGLKLDANTDSYGDRLLWGSAASVHGNPEYFGWYISPWQ